jgi:hypothetical protein
MKLMLPGAHSSNIGNEVEGIPEWMSILNEFWEEKKHHPLKSVQEEQKCEERHAMQMSI